MKLIDADKLMENKFKNDISYNAFCNLVKRQPSVDAVPVVRCRDCKIRYTVRCGMFDDDSEGEWTDDNGFCQYGESKESCTQEQ
ncbi:MAG: hypothetical protein IIZ78_21360 [Clostridiales bacterium]|nr:hypothetical protein [Clostridiales bacterium]